MTIRYSYTFGELLRCFRLRWLLSARAVPWLCYPLAGVLLIVCILPVAGVVYLAFLAYIHPTVRVLFAKLVHEIFIRLARGLVIPAALGVILGWALSRRGNMVETSPEGLVYDHLGFFKHRAPWQKIDVIQEDTQYITLGSRGNLRHFEFYAIVPKRAFASPDEAEQFFAQALLYKNQAEGLSQQPEDAWPPAPKLRPEQGDQSNS